MRHHLPRPLQVAPLSTDALSPHSALDSYFTPNGRRDTVQEEVERWLLLFTQSFSPCSARRTRQRTSVTVTAPDDPVDSCVTAATPLSAEALDLMAFFAAYDAYATDWGQHQEQQQEPQEQQQQETAQLQDGPARATRRESSFASRLCASAAASPMSALLSPTPRCSQWAHSPFAPSRTGSEAELLAAARTWAETSRRRLQRQVSITALMDSGLTYDESVRLNRLQHAETSDPAFGCFLDAVGEAGEAV